MYRFAFSLGLLLASFISSHARSMVFISKNGEKTFSSSSPETNLCLTPSCVIAAADVLTSLNETVDPCDDFYNFACGGWLKRHETTDDQPIANIHITTKNDFNRKLRDLLESKYKISEPPFVKLLKDFYSTCVNLEKEASKPLKKMLTHLGGWPVVEGSQWDESTFDCIDTLISLRKLGYNFKFLLDMYVQSDSTNCKVNRINLKEPNIGKLIRASLSLGLDDPKIAAYYRMMVKAAKLLGANKSTAKKELLEALNFEMALVNITINKKVENVFLKYFSELLTRRRKPNTFAKLQKELPQVPWLKLINGLLLTDQVYENETFVNHNPDFLVRFVDLITSTDKRVIANYMLWRAVLESKDYLSGEWRDIEKKSSKRSKNEEEPLWKKCLEEVQINMYIGLCSYYVRQYSSVESKDEAMVLMNYIHKELVKILENNDWMDEKAREKAKEKANAIKAYIGFPDELLNDTFMKEKYENLLITNYSYLENILAFQKWRTDFAFSKLRNMPMSDMINSNKFDLLLEVNAFYSPSDNSIVIPAGMLHDAIYDKDRPKYMNFGAIGFIIGHEITHGFDNTGRNYDKDGKEVSWWNKESDEQFTKKVKCIIDQYNNYTMDGGLKVNGEQTQDENIADNGGLKEAYLAYQSWIKDHGTEPLLPGLNYTQNQIFWISAAHMWCTKYEPEMLREILIYDSHSPGKFRIIGPMSNLAEFSKDFKCSPDTPMNRKYKCEVW